MEHVWFLEVKGLPSMRASSLLHILKDPDFSLLFPLLIQRLPVSLWICTGIGVGVAGVGGGRLGVGICAHLLMKSHLLIQGKCHFGISLAIWEAEIVTATSGCG